MNSAVLHLFNLKIMSEGKTGTKQYKKQYDWHIQIK